MGLRPGEVTGLPWSAVDLDAGLVAIRQMLVRMPDRSLAIGPPKAGSYRTLKMPKSLVRLLRKHEVRQKCK
jgi:integrase